MQTTTVNAANCNMRFAQITFFTSDPRKPHLTEILHGLWTTPHDSNTRIQ